MIHGRTEAEVYQVRRKFDGLCSTGGAFPWYENGGKVFEHFHDLIRHLHARDPFLPYTYDFDGQMVEIVVYEVKERATMTVREALEAFVERKDMKGKKPPRLIGMTPTVNFDQLSSDEERLMAMVDARLGSLERAGQGALEANEPTNIVQLFGGDDGEKKK